MVDDIPFVVKEYVSNTINAPKSLVDNSRDVLRKHYIGRYKYAFVYHSKYEASSFYDPC